MGHEIVFIKRQSDKKRDETIFCPKETKGKREKREALFRLLSVLFPYALRPR